MGEAGDARVAPVIAVATRPQRDAVSISCQQVEWSEQGSFNPGPAEINDVSSSQQGAVISPDGNGAAGKGANMSYNDVGIRCERVSGGHGSVLVEGKVLVREIAQNGIGTHADPNDSG